MATEHAKNRAPSAAKRWLSCPVSAYITPMYPNDETDASLKGDHWHELMELKLEFGTVPPSTDPDAAEAMDDLYDYVVRRVQELGGPGKVKIYVEQRLEIRETGEFGTGDIILVSERWIEVIDEKSGYVPVNVRGNPQLGLYLLGAIALHGERKNYRLTIHQPNYDHVDGPIRSYDPDDEYIEWLRSEIKYSMENDQLCKAGSHCKDTYCPHRGSCDAFMEYVRNDLTLGWQTFEVRSVDDAMLATALDAADELTGWRNVLRSEGMRRIVNGDREIPGYKVVKGRKQRSVREPLKLIASVCEKMGPEWGAKLFPNLEWAQEAVLQVLQAGNLITLVPSLGTAKHVEDVIKMYARAHDAPRGGWKNVYDAVVGEYINESSMGLTLERAIDGRPAHKRGSELGSLVAAPSTQDVKII